MGYKPKTIKSDFVRGKSGVATVAFSPDNKKVKVTFKEDGKAFIVPMSDCPDEIRKGTWFITMSSDEKKVLGIRPANGIFTAKVEKFIANEGEPPAPRTKVGQDWSYEFFLVLIELISDNAKGMHLPVMLRYHFGEAEEDGNSVVAFSHPKSKYTPILVEFCDVTGVWNRGPMKYGDNILPIMEKRILREDKKFQVVIKNGYADSFLELDNPDEEEIDEENVAVPQDDKPVKKTAQVTDEDDLIKIHVKKRGRPVKQEEPDEETLPDDEG